MSLCSLPHRGLMPPPGPWCGHPQNRTLAQMAPEAQSAQAVFSNTSPEMPVYLRHWVDTEQQAPLLSSAAALSWSEERLREMCWSPLEFCLAYFPQSGDHCVSSINQEVGGSQLCLLLRV